jgi:hypothetical protein
MNREGHNNVQFFYGTEVEHTPAHGRYTLFVVGVQPVDKILTQLTTGQAPVEHIYFGANQSFPVGVGINDAELWRPWQDMIKYFLSRDYLCTFDFDVSCAEGLLESGLTEYHNFIPMISVKLPYINQFGYNATIKLDDKDFRATNPGVWCHSLHELQNRSRFTDWSQYTKDTTV